MSNSNSPKRYPLNADGDFYVKNDTCMGCGAPKIAAPTLINDTDKFECYFKKQPTNKEEIQQAITAITVSCCGALRYAGNDQIILNELVKIGGREQCDELKNSLPKSTFWTNFWSFLTGFKG